jgi:hypothetical protein
MIQFVCGKPRHGKTRWAFTKLLVNELRLTDRYVCTNVAVIPEKLAECLQKKYGTDFNIRKRLRILTDQECFRFWRHFGPGLDLEGRKEVFQDDDEPEEEEGDGDKKGKKKKKRKLTVPDFSERESVSVHYLIDEAHILYPARRWYLVGDEALWCASQHAKMGDDWTFITQALSQVDSQLRGLGEEFHYMTNHAKRKQFFGLIKSANVFSRRMYYQPVKADTDQACEELRMYTLDKEIANCYKTASGVGIVGKLADVGQDKRTGLPFWTWGVVGVVALVLLWNAPSAWAWAAGKVVNGIEGKTRAAITSKSVPGQVAGDSPGAAVAAQSVKWADLQRSGSAPSVSVKPAAEDGKPFKPVYLTGVVWFGRSMARVFLSDGRVYTLADRELQYVSKTTAIVDGVLYRFCPAGVVDSSQPGRSGRP